jgi:hypothetical protein
MWRRVLRRANSSGQTSIHRDLHSTTCSNRGFGLDSGTWYRRPRWCDRLAILMVERGVTTVAEG